MAKSGLLVGSRWKFRLIKTSQNLSVQIPGYNGGIFSSDILMDYHIIIRTTMGSNFLNRTNEKYVRWWTEMLLLLLTWTYY